MMNFFQWCMDNVSVGGFLCLWFMLTGAFLGFFGTMMVNFTLYERLFRHFRAVGRRKNQKLSALADKVKELEGKLSKIEKQ
jgi:hypothetical protein